MTVWRREGDAATAVIVNEWLKTVSYKRGWEFWVNPDSPDFHMELCIRFVAEDSCHPGARTTIQAAETIPYGIHDINDFTKWFFNVLMKLEEHEAMEWLRWADTGRPVRDPHKF
jgi:hypothetical protein